MTDSPITDSAEHTRLALAKAAIPHIPFDGLGNDTLQAAARDMDVSENYANALFPRGALDLALALHRLGDQAMLEGLTGEALSDLRFRDKIAFAVKLRLRVADREAVRKAATLLALPQNAALGTQALWRTVDMIWTSLGDSSTDLNWYTKRLTLSAVYSSTLLYWLGDHSEDSSDSWAFLDRRIGEVMAIEEAKAKARANPATAPVMKLQDALFRMIKAPKSANTAINDPIAS